MSTPWPPLPLASWRDTYQTLHRYTQIIGKVQLELTPLVNHYWNVALHPTGRGLTTTPIPYQGRSFDVELDFVDHRLVVRTSDGAIRVLPLSPRPVSDFYREFLALLAGLGIQAAINDLPVEIATEAIRFREDRRHASYDPEPVERWWRIVSDSATLFQEFRARFLGKCSPVHFFWGSFDLAVSRFSGRRAPERSGADAILREAYPHEVISAGFWPGDARFPEPTYYAYAVPTPDGFADATVGPGAAFWHRELGEFLLPYDAVRRARAPREAVLQFLQSSYEAAADLAGWNRTELERPVDERTAPPSQPSPLAH